jgi:hypothetical protein
MSPREGVADLLGAGEAGAAENENAERALRPGDAGGGGNRDGRRTRARGPGDRSGAHGARDQGRCGGGRTELEELSPCHDHTTQERRVNRRNPVPNDGNAAG